MPEKGYIYALINPSLSDLIKVGKTTKEPEDRAKELSSGTGIPTPFIVAYKIYVNDCSAAESFLHTLLDIKGYRINDNREFFNAPLNEIIESILKVQEKFGVMNYQIKESCNEEFEFQNESYGDDFLDSLTIKDDPPYKEVIEQADAFYYGEGDVFQDYSEALKLYIKAAKLGAIEVYLNIGQMYINGKGCNKSYETALKYLKEGAIKGNDDCYAEMGLLFFQMEHYQNAEKCYQKYFESDTFRYGKGNFRGYSDSISVQHYTHEYTYLLSSEIIPLNIKKDIAKYIEQKLEFLEAKDKATGSNEAENYYNNFLRSFERAFSDLLE